MSEYFVTVFVICVVTGILGILSYNDKCGAERAAIGVILLFVVLSPVAETLMNLDAEDFDPEKIISDIKVGTEFSEVGEAALSDGICRAVSREFSLEEDEVSATLYGFDFEKMKAEKIRVLLSGRAALSDSKAVKKFVDEMGVGECEIGIELGQQS